jgi:hypothetical protein
VLSSGTGSGAELSSILLHNLDESSVKLSFFAAPAVVDDDGVLSIHASSETGASVPLLELDARLCSPSRYEPYAVVLPAAVLQGEFRITFKTRGSAEWLLDNVDVCAARVVLIVKSRPDEAANVGVYPPDMDGNAAGEPAFVRRYQEPTPVTLSAPARSGRLAFERWLLDGRCATSGDGAFTQLMTGDAIAIAQYALLGDMNGDERLDRFDLDAFVLAMIDPDEYAERHPELDRLRRGDLNGDGVIDRADIEPFVESLLDPRAARP